MRGPSGSLFRVSPCAHTGELRIWCNECDRDSGFHHATCSRANKDRGCDPLHLDLDGSNSNEQFTSALVQHGDAPSAVIAEALSKATRGRWRVGRKLGRTLYLDEQFVGVVDTPEIAAAIVAAMNGAMPPFVGSATAPGKQEAR